MYLIYNILLYILYPIIFLFSLFSVTIAQNLKIRFKVSQLPSLIPENCYWFHSASVGEYEQARILAIQIRSYNPKAYIVMSVFSYSGYSQRKNDNVHDLFFALPFDFNRNIKALLYKIKPKLIIYAKYDIWPNMARNAFHFKIPQFIISASLAQNSNRLKPFFRMFYSKVYSYMNGIYTIGDPHTKRFYELGLKAETMGDTRFDSIQMKLSEKNFFHKEIKIIQKMARINKQNIFLAGSTYFTSEKFLIDFASQSKNTLIVLVPHHVNTRHMNKIESLLEKKGIIYDKYSNFFQKDQIPYKKNFQIFLIDIVGILPFLYSIADICYVGGGWEGSIHSVIEAACFGLPLLTGPHILNSQEAIDMSKMGLIEIMKKPIGKEVAKWYQTSYKNIRKLKQLKISIKQFFNQRTGSTNKIILRLKERNYI